MMDLFGMETKEARPGYRLQRLEVYNWGTFDEAVWPFVLDGDTSLLTGDIGTGKSTMVDALLTLLVPQRKISYNKAADSSARERSLTSYTRGYYAKRINASGIEEPAALRDSSAYSVILALFRDEMAGSDVTLAQVFWYRPGESRPAHFCVAAERALSIQKDFGGFGRHMNDLKKKLRKMDYVRLFDHFSDYADRYQSLFGIRQAHAMELFQQIVSMKKVSGITEFVRDNMLDDGEFLTPIRASIDRMLAQFHSLQSIHDAIVRAREKLALLAPLTAGGEAYLAGEKELEDLRAMQEGLSPWIASQDIRLRQEDQKAMGELMEELELRIFRLKKDLAENEVEIDRKKRESWEQGGSRIESAREQLRQLREALKDARRVRSGYDRYAECLALPAPETEEIFLKNRTRMAAIKEAAEVVYKESGQKIRDLDSGLREAVSHIASDTAELASLRQRTTNIPSGYLDVRDRLAKAIGASPWEMPFVGEILEVRPEEAGWEGALERLLHEFGLSLLVPEGRYGDVIRWMEKNRIRMNFVYYRVEEDIRPESMDRVGEKGAARKLRIKEDSPFRNWVLRELVRRFDHTCCDTMQEFRKEDFALTPQGQIKTQGRRHRKDDRFDIHDRLRYVLGFSNKEKIKALEQDLSLWQRRKEEAEKKIAAEQKKAEEAIQERSDSEYLLHMTDFSALDTAGAEKAVRAQEQLIHDFEKNHDILRKLEAAIARLKEEGRKLAEDMNQALRDQDRCREELAVSREQEAADREILAACGEELRRAAFPLLDKHRGEVWGEKAVLTSKSAKDKENAYRKWLEGQTAALHASLAAQAGQLIQQMLDYLNDMGRHNESDPNLNRDLTAQNLGEYRAVEERIRRDDLPRLQPAFRKRLREESIKEMALFRSRLENLGTTISERIEEINGSLRSIDYNPGRYIRIEYQETVNSEIRQFRKDLHQATDNRLTGDEDHYSEQKFLESQKILARFDANRLGHTEADARWTARVTDVRNWYLFAISERLRGEGGTDGGEYEHYTDSSGKSGGQKEKLAYTILAASFVYSFGIEGGSTANFRFAAIDEAFLKSSDESARFGLELFKTLGIQLLLVTPLSKIPTIEPYVSHVGFVSQNGRRSELRNMTIGEYKEEAKAYETEKARL